MKAEEEMRNQYDRYDGSMPGFSLPDHYENQ